MSENHPSEPLPIQGVLIDLAGVVYLGSEMLPGSAEAIRRLRQAGLPVRYLTNTTRKTRSDLLAKLSGLGLDLDPEEVFTAPLAARGYLLQHELTPLMLIHPALRPEFEDLAADPQQADAVVVGDAGDAFTYEALNEALNALVRSPRLIAMGDNRYFKDGDRLALDMGPFVHALAYAADVEPVVVGKPAEAFFEQALASLGCEASAAVMIGDDLRSDVGGAQAAGMRGVLVRTGKYRPADEQSREVYPEHVADDLAAAVDWLLQR